MAVTEPQTATPKSKPRWRKYSLRLLLLFILISSVPCTLLAIRLNKAWQQSIAVEAILKCEGCSVLYDWHGTITCTRDGWKLGPGDAGAGGGTANFGPLTVDLGPDAVVVVVGQIINCYEHGCPWDVDLPGPKTVGERLFGKHFARHVVTVEARSNRVDEILPQLQRLPYLRTVTVFLVGNGHDDKVDDSVIERTKQALPGVEVGGIEYDFSLQQNTHDPTAAGFLLAKSESPTDWPPEWTGFADVTTKLAWALFLLRL
jgi:hypothetical protein